MRKFLFLAYALTFSVVAIGSPEPDRQIPEHQEYKLTDTSDKLVSTVTPVFAEAAVITVKEAVFDVSFNTDVYLAILPDAVAVNRERTDEVIEDSPKPKDRYRLPIWEYIPSIEPPSQVKTA
jgi:hypothetical protein